MDLLSKLHLTRRSVGRFNNIYGYEGIKEIIERVLHMEDSYNLLLIGPPASAKTLFLVDIIESEKAVLFDGSNTTNRILDVLEEKRPKIILLDEIDKMSRQFQNQLLGFMESGRVDVEQQRKQYHFKIEGAKVFATCNELNRLSKPLRSRFRKLILPRYDEIQFVNVSVKVLKNISDSMARYIGYHIFHNNGDIRDVISVGKLIQRQDGPKEVDGIINTLLKYGKEVEG